MCIHQKESDAAVKVLDQRARAEAGLDSGWIAKAACTGDVLRNMYSWETSVFKLSLNGVICHSTNLQDQILMGVIV
jgi:hypothetical protein